MVWQCWGFGSDSQISHVTASPRCVASSAGNFRPGRGRGLSVPKEDWSTGQLFGLKLWIHKTLALAVLQDILAIWWEGDIFLYSWLTSEELEQGGSGRLRMLFLWLLKCDPKPKKCSPQKASGEFSTKTTTETTPHFCWSKL